MSRAARWAFPACCALLLSAAARDPWLRIESPNFEVFTTAGERSGRDLARHFEQVRSFFVQAFGAIPVEAHPVRVIAFHNDQEYLPYRPSEAAFAFYHPGLARDYIVMSRGDAEYYPEAVHEYIHLLIQQGGKKVPLWLNEGMADLYSTIDAVGGQIVVGKEPPGHARSLAAGEWVDLNTILAVGVGSPLYNEKARVGMFYAESWALTHMLLLDPRYRSGRKALMDSFAAGEEAAAAFQKAYSKPIADVQKDLHGYVNSDRITVALFNVQLAKANESPEISGGSPHAGLALAEMTAETAGKSEQALQAYQQLSHDYPANWEVEGGWGTALLHLGKTGEAVAHFARALGLGCHDLPTLIAYSQTLIAERRNAEAVGVLKTAAQLNPAQGDVHRQLGMALVRAGSYPDALSEFAKAGKVDVSDAAEFFYTVAYAYYRVGDKALAREALDKAANYAKTEPEKTMIGDLRPYLDAEVAHVANLPPDILQAPKPKEDGESGPPSIVRREPVREEPPPAVPKPEPLPVADGTLQEVDCAGKLLRVMTRSSVIVLKILDPDNIVIKNGDGGSVELTCGPQKAKRIRVEYAKTPGLPSSVAGAVRSIEFP